ncbi:hypothetical protein HD596_002914 [Nonomuraea jabiensis]|uniref:Uncharacterized protein n=1 Tax=Nonomuraea jabiensis TaxID=882448 RepID=A0A7W9LA59_9ACTN|nr:hypothetical protein [Nonomuraea jabiensis]
MHPEYPQVDAPRPLSPRDEPANTSPDRPANATPTSPAT